jgi:predicted DsbA family dithiol-disulfide isomerase
MHTRLKTAADNAGLPLGRRTMTYNSRLAHEVGKWADTQAKGDEYHRAVFKAFFVDNTNISSLSVLIGIAGGIGLSEESARAAVEQGEFSDAVDADWSRSLEIDPDYIPSLMVNDRLLVNPQEYSLWEQFMMENNVERRTIDEAPS